MHKQPNIFLVPTFLAEDSLETIPLYVIDAIKKCDVFYVENEKTTRRYFKKLWKEMVIDNYEWHTIHKTERELEIDFLKNLKAGKTIGIVSEAGCPGVADPGQILINIAQKNNAIIKPLVGPSSILLSLMASGLNGQSFQFTGYLPIDGLERKKKIKEIELYAQKNNCTQIFIETPYRNNQLFKDIIQTCHINTQLCIAVDITSNQELIVTKSIGDWNKETIDLHKHQVIFLML